MLTAQINTKAAPEVDKNAVMSQLQTVLQCTRYFIRFANLKETSARIPPGFPLGLQNVFLDCVFRHKWKLTLLCVMKHLRVKNF